MLISPPGNFKLSVIIERTVMCFLLTGSLHITKSGKAEGQSIG